MFQNQESNSGRVFPMFETRGVACKYLYLSKKSRAAICTERGATVAILAGAIHAGRRQATMRIAHAEFIAELEREGERATMVQVTPHVI